MIQVPTRGLARSVEEHNVELAILCDWIEASVLFTSEELSLNEVADRLIEETFYDSQEFALEIVQNAWIELERRSQICRFYGITVNGGWVRPQHQWTDNPGHSFCLTLSLATNYDWWVAAFGRDYTEQGELFELLTKASLAALIGGWRTYVTGWSRSNAAALPEIAKEVAKRVTAGVANLELWDGTSAKDLGLDLLCYRPFPDAREGFPYILLQCASGANWRDKTEQPNLEVWRQIIRPYTVPMRGFAVPFCHSEDEFKRTCIKVTGLVLDRCRLLGAADEDWLANGLGDRIVNWTRPRVETLLARSG